MPTPWTGRVWAGHNIVHFDSMIIMDAFAEIGRPPPQPKAMIDTLPLLTQCFGPRAGDMKLASLANYFGLGKQRHRSLDDVKMNIDVFKNCATVLFLVFPDLLFPRELAHLTKATISNSLSVRIPIFKLHSTNITFYSVK
ncbi:Protein NEN2 [Zea mays]|uniref:Protein NEN2 n=1 Tax=Zea mays TaxID=4577 RepID=A0A1D6K821_MAIZE|nr:Protein NEN2 [Zea mays]